MELASLLRRTRRNAKSLARIFLLLTTAGLAACTEVPPEYNPVEWARKADLQVKSWFSDTPPAPAPIVEPPPAEGRPFPNLGTVPKAPPRDTPETRADRQRQLSALQADRNASVSADTGLRTEGKFPGPPPAPQAAPAPAATQAPSSAAPETGRRDRPEPPASAGPPGPLEALLSPPVPIVPPAVAQAPEPPQPPEARLEEPPRPAVSTAAAAPAPVPPAAPVLTTSERRGSVSFARDARAPSGASERVLQEAASFAVAKTGRVRLVPAQYARGAGSSQQSQARAEAMQRILTGSGLSIDRITVADGAGQRVDVYDVYVDY